MPLFTILLSVGQACEGLDVVNRTEKKALGRQFKEERAEVLNEGTVSCNIGVPVTRIPYRFRGIRDGPRQLTALAAKAAPLSAVNLLARIAV
jgi:hypothetical protein